MKQKQIKRCPFCKNTFKSLSSHLQRSKKCIAKYNSRAHIQHLRKSLYHKLSKPNMEQGHNTMNGCMLDLKFPIASLPLYNQEVEYPSEYQQNDNIDNLTSYHSIEDEVSDYHNDDDYCKKILKQYFQLQKNKRAIIDPQVIFLSHLLKLLHETNAPLYLFEKIVDWAIVSIENGFKFDRKYPSREKLIKIMSKVCCLDELSPKSSKLILSTREEVTINFFDFEQQCFSLLTDTDLMKDDNLCFPNDDPCKF